MKKDKTQKNKNEKLKLDIKDMGVDIDKNEYREIVLSQSNQPERSFYEKYYD